MGDGEPYLREGNYVKFWPIHFERLFQGGEGVYSRFTVVRLCAKNDKKVVQVLLIANCDGLRTIEG